MRYDFNVKENGKVLSGFIVLLGLWLIVAPWLLGYGYLTTAFWNSLIVGVVVAVIALARIILPNEFANVSWLNAALGLWLILSPFVFNYGTERMVEVGNINSAVGNHIVTGIFLTVLAWLSAEFNNPRWRG